MNTTIPIEIIDGANAMMAGMQQRIATLEADNARLRDALKSIAKQMTSAELEEWEVEEPDFKEGYNAIIAMAQKVLAGKEGA